MIWNMNDEILNLRYYIKKIDPQNYGFKKKILVILLFI